MPRLFPQVLFFVLALCAARPSAGQSLYADPKARAVGDPLTIVLAERTAAKSRSQYADRSQAGFGGTASADGGTLNGRFGLDANLSQAAAAQNEATQSDLLSGTLTALVVGVDASGNLQVEGERTLQINGVTHVMKVEGVVRPLDVRYDNTVLSYQIANAKVAYRQKGLRARFLKPATLLKAGAAVLLAAALLLGGTQ